MTSNAVVNALSHEMSELVTDPQGFGIMHTLFNYASEVADVCAAGTSGAIAGFATPPVPFLATQAVTYASNSACACIPAWTNTSTTFNPLRLSMAPDGSSSMRVQITGNGFGEFPADFGVPSSASPLVRNTPYLSLAATTAGGSAPHAFAGDSVDATHGGTTEQTARLVAWSENQVQAEVGVAFANFCDTLELTVWNPKGGTASTAQTVFGGSPDGTTPGLTVTLGVTAAARAGTMVTVSGFVRDSNGIPVGYVHVNLTGGSFDDPTPMTHPDGSYFAHLTVASGLDNLQAAVVDCNGIQALSPTRTIDGCSIGAGRATDWDCVLMFSMLGLAVLLKRRWRRGRPVR